MPKKITNKYLIVAAHNDKINNGFTDDKIAKLFRVCRKTIHNYVNDPDLTDEIKRAKKEYPSKLIDFIIKRAVNNHNFNFKSMRKTIKKEFNFYIKKHELYRILKENNMTYKRANIKNTTRNTKRSLDDIQKLHNKITTINHDNIDDIIFTDEVHVKLDDVKTYGWNNKNTEVTFIKNTPKEILNKRVSLIASFSKNKKIGYSLTYGKCNGIKYKKHIKKINKIVHKKYHYHDGARIHTAKIVKNSMNRMGIKSIVGVPYTPELNIAEYFFNIFKKKIKSTFFDKRTNMTKLIRNCWNSIDDSVLSKTYEHVYNNIEFCNRCI
jgi:transposase